MKFLKGTLNFRRSITRGRDTLMSMRRKSERNKAKATPEKKVEKPTRKSTRRRGKRSPSTSPEKDNIEAATTVVPSCINENEKSPVQTRIQNKELEQVSDSHEEKVSSTEGNIKVQSPEAEEENNGDSVWKVARADASPGEIQKLKLCRQRNISEASSEASLSRKKSNKWQESGEGGAGEVDSADEQLVSCTRMSSGIEQPYDPSSSYPGQDSNEEVSDSKELLPETTSANLSDDKPNIDQQGDSNEASCSNQNLHSEPSKPTSTTTPATTNSSNGDRVSEELVPDIPKEDQPEETTDQKSTEVFEKETSSENASKEMHTNTDDEEHDDKEKIQKSDSSSESNDEKHTKIDCSSNRTALRASRRKHRNKYRDSSNSETPDSEDEQPVDNKFEQSFTRDKKSNTTTDESKEKDQPTSPESKSNPSLNNLNIEVEHSEINKSTKAQNETEKQDHVPSTNVQASTQKPAKVNLKRSFTSRILVDKTDAKSEDTDPNANSESNNQKENHSNEDNEFKSVPRKRRWGTALSTDSVPSFSISTDSLKALVPGAKPLSINEVRLSKDDDDERDQKGNGKWFDEDINDPKSKDILAQKNGAAKKGDLQIENHIAARRKISIMKEPSHVKSPSPPATKPTNILLIKNLVRPFTLNQIKELLSRTGTIVENGFWMDRIKSKCFVEYANEDQAFETRQALHGISWPVSNPKRLHVEYATKDDMEMARESSKDQPVSRKTEQLLTTESWQQDWNREERTNSAKVVVVREWDLGKEDGQQHVKEKERDKKEQDKKRRRSRSPALEAHLPAPARKFKKKEDDPPPAKLLDDLFRKTKATPCIYWLPLTNEQIVVKEEMRRQHMAEHARRLEEMRRTERSRDSRRRRSPRK